MDIVLCDSREYVSEDEDGNFFFEEDVEECNLELFNQDSKTMYVVKGGWVREWNGRKPVMPHVFDNLRMAIESTFMNSPYFDYKVYYETEFNFNTYYNYMNGLFTPQLCCDGTHHDSNCDCNHFIIKELTDKGYELYQEIYSEGRELPKCILKIPNTIQDVKIKAIYNTI